jgi:hypothetical protein
VHLNGCKSLHNGLLLCAPFPKGHKKVNYLARFKEGAHKCMNSRMHTTVSSSKTSVVGSDFGSGVDTYDVFHWERILASFIANSSAALGHRYIVQTIEAKVKNNQQSKSIKWQQRGWQECGGGCQRTMAMQQWQQQQQCNNGNDNSNGKGCSCSSCNGGQSNSRGQWLR